MHSDSLQSPRSQQGFCVTSRAPCHHQPSRARSHRHWPGQRAAVLELSISSVTHLSTSQHSTPGCADSPPSTHPGLMTGKDPFAAFREVKPAARRQTSLSKSNASQAPVLPASLPQQHHPQQQSSPQLPAGTSAPAPSFTDHDIPEVERVLRAFDLTTKFGPCAGLTRLERWERAQKFGLDPPQDIRQLLLQHGADHPLNQCIWAGRV